MGSLSTKIKLMGEVLLHMLLTDGWTHKVILQVTPGPGGRGGVNKFILISLVGITSIRHRRLQY